MNRYTSHCKLIKQYNKTIDLCNKANSACQELERLISPFIHEDIRDDINVFEQHGDGLVMEWESYNYSITEVIEVIKRGERDIDMRTWNCPITAI